MLLTFTLLWCFGVENKCGGVSLYSKRESLRSNNMFFESGAITWKEFTDFKSSKSMLWCVDVLGMPQWLHIHVTSVLFKALNDLGPMFAHLV